MIQEKIEIETIKKPKLPITKQQLQTRSRIITVPKIQAVYNYLKLIATSSSLNNFISCLVNLTQPCNN